MSEEIIKHTAVVTGASRGIGRAIAAELAEKGFSVAIGYNGNEAAAEETRKLLEELNPGGRHFICKGNMGEEADCQQLIDRAAEEFSRIDVLVNNAGATQDGLVLRMGADAFDRVIGINLRGAFFCCRAAAKYMLRQKYGRIVNISSVVGLHGNAGQANYAASKAGLIGLTKSLAKEFASRGITVNAVAPGFIETDMTAAMTEEARMAVLREVPLKRKGEPKDVAKAVAFLASEDAAYITGQVLSVDGGMGM
ncbi:MAG: 3-oxoacyl-[acyl-carrier-protein] reductase [Lachnospiraceae bacterium]|nr:3-oxoacyl-[acyl-carrier-protein] reductase [Lachnospiraceae bacterium]